MMTLISEVSSMMIDVYSYISKFFYDSLLGGILINVLMIYLFCASMNRKVKKIQEISEAKSDELRMVKVYHRFIDASDRVGWLMN